LRIFEDKVLREMFGLRREKPMEDWRKLLEKLYILYLLPNIDGVVKSRRTR
jgi:hypothetical protein